MGNKGFARAGNKDNIVRDSLGLDGRKLANVGGADEAGTCIIVSNKNRKKKGLNSVVV